MYVHLMSLHLQLAITCDVVKPHVTLINLLLLIYRQWFQMNFYVEAVPVTVLLIRISIFVQVSTAA